MTATAFARIPAASDQITEAKEIVERKSGMTRDEFIENYLRPRKPVILDDVMPGWAASRWTDSFFRERFGERPVTVSRGKELRRITFGRYIDYVGTIAEKATRGEATGLPLYLRNIVVHKDMPELLADFTVHPFFLPNWMERWPMRNLFPLPDNSGTNLFLGPPGAMIPVVHRDRFMTHAWISECFGLKQVWLISPEETAFVYQNPENRDLTLLKSLKQPDLQQFPLLAHANIMTTVLRPGETVFVPAGWWHSAECVTTAISLSGNFINDSNFKDFRNNNLVPWLRQQGPLQRMYNNALFRLSRLAYRMRDRKTGP